MKKLIFTLVAAFLVQLSFSQTTYYWVGGTNATGGASGGWNTGANWNTALDGSGSSRPSASAGNNDILIFDGSNVGGSTPVTGSVTVDVTSNEFGAIKFINAATVTLSRLGSGTSTLTMNGDGTGVHDFVIASGSSFTLSGAAGVQIVNGASVTGEIYGTFTLTGGAHRFTAPANVARAILFKNGSVFNQGTGHSGNPFGNAASTNAVSNDNIYFEDGSTYNYVAGSNPFALTAPASLVDFALNSTFNVNSTSIISLSGRPYGNLVFNGSQSPTSNPTRLNNLIIASGVTISNNSNSAWAVYGNIIVDGTLTFTGTPTFVLCGNGSTQTIGGSGTISATNRIIVASGANVVLNRNLSFAPSSAQTSSIFGSLDLGTYTLTGNSNSSFSVRNPVSATSTGNITAGSTTIGNISSYTNVSVGMSISGPGIPSGAIITSTTSPNLIISIPATTSTTAANLTITNTAGTLKTSNAGGLDGALQNFTTINLNDQGSYIFNAPTTTPFPASISTVSIGNLTNNASITLNKNITVNGALTLNAAKVIIPAGNVLEMPSSASIAGATSSNYIVTEVNTSTGTQGALKISGFATAKTFPVGSATNYLPVTLTPLSASDFTVTAFEGITNEGTPNGTAMAASQKAEVVNAVWTINRISANTDDCDVTLNWTPALEGATFTTLANNQIGVSRHDGTSWSVVAGSGDNTANFATNTFNSFSPFAVGRKGVVLPIQFINFNAILTNGKVALKWNVQNELGLDKYVIERSANGINFSPLSNLAARNALITQYDFIDAQPISGTTYYRIKSISANGAINYTGIVKVGAAKATSLEVYPNPVKGKTINLSFTPATEGVYTLTLVNSAGQQIMSRSLGQISNNFNSSVVLPSNVQPGLYTMMIRSADSQVKQTILIQ
jgi:hypothetical protein